MLPVDRQYRQKKKLPDKPSYHGSDWIESHPVNLHTFCDVKREARLVMSTDLKAQKYEVEWSYFSASNQADAWQPFDR